MSIVAMTVLCVYSWVADPDRTYVQAASERADSLAQEEVLLVKLDVEGFEPQAMRSLKGLFDHHK